MNTTEETRNERDDLRLRVAEVEHERDSAVAALASAREELEKERRMFDVLVRSSAAVDAALRAELETARADAVRHQSYAEGLVEHARALACEEAARHLRQKIQLFKEIDVSMTRHEENEWHAQQILALAPLPPTLVALPVAEVEQMKSALKEARAADLFANSKLGEAMARNRLPDHLVAVPVETLEKVKAELGEAVGSGHGLKAFAATMLRWNEPGVDFSDEARRVVDHADRWHKRLVAAQNLLAEVGT